MSGDSILVTGGAGFVGSHSVIELIKAGYTIVVLDNFRNASLECIKRLEVLTSTKVTTYNADITDKSSIQEVFRKVMKEHNVKNLVFSSSCTVFGNPQYLPLDEDHPTGGCTNPYGKTKYIVEEMLKDLTKADPEWNIVCLRYFNPVGAHPSGAIGEDPNGVPTNLMPFCTQVATGLRNEVYVFGNDYDTQDGTAVRDYIHVLDVAEGHLAALKKIAEDCGLKIYNLGTGKGYSVLEVIDALGKAAERRIPYKIISRRKGDVPSCYAGTEKAFKELKWKANRGLDEMCADAWRWQSHNPNGYSSN